MDISSLLDGLKGLFFKGTDSKPISPLPTQNTLQFDPNSQSFNQEQNNPGLASYYARENRLSNQSPMGQYTQPSAPPANNVIPKSTSVSNATPTPTPFQQVLGMIDIPSVSKVNPDFIPFLYKEIFPYTDALGIPRAIAGSQTAAESGFGTSPIARNNNNYWGIRDPQNPGQFMHFKNVQEGLPWYTGTLHSKVGDFSQYKNNALALLEKLQSNPRNQYEGDNTNPNQYVYDVSHNPLWGPLGGGATYPVNPYYQK